MITIEIKLFANLREYYPKDLNNEGSVKYEIDKSSTIRDLYHELEIPEEQVKVNFVNNTRKSKNYTLQNNDKVAIFPPIAGG